MITEDAYQTLKNCLELDSDEIEDAYECVIENPDEYRVVVEQHKEETKASIEIGQSPVALGELIRQFYNATHRQIDDEIVDLPGAEFCKELGKVASESIQQIVVINKCSEEMAAVKISCDSTVDMSYA